jgi:hypothetical protein
MKNIHVLATPNPSRLAIHRGILKYNSPSKKATDFQLINRSMLPQNIYITSDEEIKANVYALINGVLCKTELLGDRIVSRQLVGGATMDICKSEYFEIILTTDQDLIADGIQPIDDEFLEWFVKNPSCEEIEVYKVNGKLFAEPIIPKEEPKLTNVCIKCGVDLYYADNFACQEHPKNCKGIHLSEETLKERALKEEPKQDAINYSLNAFKVPKEYFGKEEPKQEIVGYRLNSNISRLMVDRVLQYSMPKWNDEDKSVYFIRGHVAGSLVAKMKELQVLDLWFIPIYEDEEIKSDWIKEHHLEYYYKEGIMKEEPKQETEHLLSTETNKKRLLEDVNKQETIEEHYLSIPKPLVDVSRMKVDNHPDIDNKETLEEVSPMQELIILLDKIKKNLTNKNEVITIQLIIDTVKNQFVDKELKWQQEQDKKMYSELSLFLEKEADKDRLKSLTSNQIRTLIEQFKKK